MWCFVGDGESDEPETLGSLTLASRENLDNLIWVVNCNLQRLDGPVRGNGKIIQELEAAFRGAGWNVIKVIWGSNWDPLIAADTSGLLIKRMEEAVDGDYQKYSVEPGSYTRKHFFGKYPELLKLVNHLTDAQIHKLLRGGHDSRKVYAAYRAAVEHRGAPTVILAKTIKGYGLGEAGEGRNISHQQKKMNEKELREFRARFNIPISDEVIAETPFYRPPGGQPGEPVSAGASAEPGRVPARTSGVGGGDRDARTGVFRGVVQGLRRNWRFRPRWPLCGCSRCCCKHKELGQRIVPIIPDEARTFGMDALFREIGNLRAQGSAVRTGGQQVAAATITRPRTARSSRKASPRPGPCRRSSPRARPTPVMGST